MARVKSRDLWRKAELAINEAICETHRDELSDRGWVKAAMLQRYAEELVAEVPT